MPEKSNTEKKLLQIVKESSPNTVRELLEIAEKELEIPQKELLDHILKLNDEEKLGLTIPNENLNQSHQWFWIVAVLSISAGIAIILIPENLYPYVYIRNVLGLILVVLLPGFSLTITLYPRKQIDNIERLGLSIGLSLAMVAITGLVLNFTPLGIKLLPLTICLIAITLILSYIGAKKNNDSQQKSATS